MARWPRTVIGNVLAIALALIAGAFGVQLAVALSGPVVWSFVAITLVLVLGLYAWSARVHRAQDLAVAGAPSFADAFDRGRRGDHDRLHAAVPAEDPRGTGLR